MSDPLDNEDVGLEGGESIKSIIIIITGTVPVMP